MSGRVQFGVFMDKRVAEEVAGARSQVYTSLTKRCVELAKSAGLWRVSKKSVHSGATTKSSWHSPLPALTTQLRMARFVTCSTVRTPVMRCASGHVLDR